MAPTKKLPLYRKVINHIKDRVASGEYRTGDMLPSENELCKEFSTTRVTIRHALTELINLGLIIRYHGKGSIISEPKNALGILSVRGVTAGVGNLNLKTSIITKPNKAIWPEDFFFPHSEKEKLAGCIYFSRIRTLEGRPVIYEETYISNVNLPRFVKFSLEDRSLFSFLKEKYEVEIKGGEQKIWAINANKGIAGLLELKKGHPVVHMKRKLDTNNNNLHVYSFLYCNTDEFYLQDNF